MLDSEMNEVVDSVFFEEKLYDCTNHGFDEVTLINEHALSNKVETLKNSGSGLSSPTNDNSSWCNKSQNSIEDLNKEIERLFLNNENFGFTSFVYDRDEMAEGRKAPIADMLHCYTSCNRRKKRRSATALGIRNYESDTSNNVSSPEDNSGCEEYSEKNLNNKDPSLIVPVPEKSGIDKLQTVSISGPFSSNKLQLSVDSAFAPIKSIPRSECTFHRNPIDTDENQENEVF